MFAYKTFEDFLAERLVRLTKRDLETLFWIYDGKSSRQAADKMFVSKRTIDFHLGRAYVKISVSNRVQAFNRLERLGMMPDVLAARPRSKEAKAA